MAPYARLLAAALLIVGASVGCKSNKTENKTATDEPAPVDQTDEPEGADEVIAVTWAVGDADRGREVFVTQKCFRCHQVLLDDGLMELHRASQAEMANMGDAAKPGADKHAGMDHGAHGAGDTPTGHHLPPPLNAGTLAKPGLIMVQQTLAPSASPAAQAAHTKRLADAMTVGDMTDVVTFLAKISRMKPPKELAADDLELRWPDGDAAAGKTAFGAHSCGTCHPVPGASDVKPPAGTPKGPALTRATMSRHRLVLVRSVVLGNGATGHPGYSRSATLRQLTDIAAFLASQP